MTIEFAAHLVARAAAGAALFACANAFPASAQIACACNDAGETEGFRAVATITDAHDWQERWNTPPEVAPEFPAPEGALFLGETGHLLVFFANAATLEGAAELSCDIRISRPNGKVTDEGPLPRGQGPISGPPENLRLTSMRMDLEVEPTDPSGLWQFDIGVTDVVRGVRVPLHLAFPVDASRERPAQ